MAKKARYVHTNVVAHDWQALASFYQRVFGCSVVPPERHFSGAALEAGTAVAGARIDGVHLRLPGHGAAGPTLEVFSYARAPSESALWSTARVLATWRSRSSQLRRCVKKYCARAVGQLVRSSRLPLPTDAR